MSFTMKLALVLFGLAYLISPVDLIPDLLLPWVGWIDDGVILWSIYYLIRYGELPWFLFKKKAGKQFPGRPAGPGPQSKSNRNSRRTTKQNQTKQKPGTGRSEARGKKFSPSNKPPYEILGVAQTASWPEVQAAYKEKIKQYHPDKLQHLGKEFADLANEKFLEIQAAYGKLKEQNKN